METTYNTESIHSSNQSTKLPRKEEQNKNKKMKTAKETESNDDLKHLAKSILLDTSKEYFKIVNDQIFIFNPDTGLFENLKEPSKEALSQIGNVYDKKFLDKNYKVDYDEDDEDDEGDEDNNTTYINFKALYKVILDKINLNRNFYCDKDIDDVRSAVIPLLDRRMYFKNQKEGKLKPNHLAFTSLDYCLSVQTSKKLNRILNFIPLQEDPYITFLKGIQNSTAYTGNIGSYAQMLFKDIAINAPTYSGKMCYVISCDDRRMQELFWVPIENMVPSSYKTYMSFHNSEVRKHASHMIGKAINIHFGLPSEMNKNQKMFLCENLLRCVPITLFYPKSSYNYINRTIQVFLVNTSEAQDLSNIFKEFGVEKLAHFIKLPLIQDLEKSLQDELNEPDFIEELLSDKDGIINLLYADWGKPNENEALQKLTYTDSKEDFVEKYLEFTGKESDIISKEDLYQSYCQSYPDDHFVKSVFSKFLKNYNKLYINRTDFKKMDTQEQARRFTDIKRDGVSYWVGLKIKSIE